MDGFGKVCLVPSRGSICEMDDVDARECDNTVPGIIFHGLSRVGAQHSLHIN